MVFMQKRCIISPNCLRKKTVLYCTIFSMFCETFSCTQEEIYNSVYIRHLFCMDTIQTYSVFQWQLVPRVKNTDNLSYSCTSVLAKSFVTIQHNNTFITITFTQSFFPYSFNIPVLQTSMNGWMIKFYGPFNRVVSTVQWVACCTCEPMVTGSSLCWVWVYE